MSRCKTAAVVTFVLASALVAGWVFLFRTHKTVRPDGSTIWIDRSFGKPVRLRVDENADGMVDRIASTYVWENTIINAEVWLDRDADEVFEYHFLPGTEAESFAEIDSDGDGQYDIQLHGVEAHELYCRWSPCGPIY